MIKKVIEASEAVAIGAKLCKPDVIAVYPITPQTHIPEKIANFVYDGKMDCELVDVESEHSALSACQGAQAAGARTFTATASQGLALMHEVLFATSGLRLPVVMAVANRALSAPINIWNDHQDSISARDSGWIQFYVESAQEALDTMIMAFKVAENKDIMLPAMVCLDGFTLTHVYEPAQIPEQKEVDSFLPPYKPLFTLDPKKPLTMGPIGYPNSYMDFKLQQQQAMQKALTVIKQVQQEFLKRFKRTYGNGLIEAYKTKDADIAVVAMGTICSTTKDVVDELRKKGRKVGLIKIKTFRPFPEADILDATKNLKAIAVLDRNISLGQEGAVYSEIKAVLKDCKTRADSYIVGLGGRDVTPNTIKTAIDKTSKSKNPIKEWLMQ
ncbi:pyruvate ferredoxin oxidoreductase [Candidatus Woesearchaeota archaeon]|nr:pyruvate ferredoxin oxidoreductase [Candidatus Woesearchaeota archaeon]